MVPRILGYSRFLVILAVIATFLAASTLMVVGFATVVKIIVETISHPDINEDSAKHLSVAFIELIDLFLVRRCYILSLSVCMNSLSVPWCCLPG